VLFRSTVPAAALVASRAQAGPLLYVAAMVVYGAGAVLCHQQPSRSFHPWGVQMPVCARCLGIYAGAALASLAAIIAIRRRATGGGMALAPRLTPTAFVLAAVPTLLTLVFEWWSGQMPSHWTRAAAGVPLGAIVTAVVVAAASDQVN
jgi:hypothetical protein